MNEPVYLSPLEDIDAVSFSPGEEFYYPDTHVCHWCKNPWHRPWFATATQIAAASAGSSRPACLRQLLAAMPGLKTLKGKTYQGSYDWDTGVLYILTARQKMRTPK